MTSNTNKGLLFTGIVSWGFMPSQPVCHGYIRAIIRDWDNISCIPQLLKFCFAPVLLSVIICVVVPPPPPHPCVCVSE